LTELGEKLEVEIEVDAGRPRGPETAENPMRQPAALPEWMDDARFGVPQIKGDPALTLSHLRILRLDVCNPFLDATARGAANLADTRPRPNLMMVRAPMHP
jgi:hypothetical protein